MDNNHELESQVMAKIKNGQVKLRSKYIFLAEKFGLGGAFILSLFLAVLFFSLLLFYLRASDNLFYLSFGSGGLFAFLESFPYLLVITLIIAILISGLIMKKSDISYQKSFSYFASGMLIFIVISGGVLSLTNIAEGIQKNNHAFSPMHRFFSPFGDNEARDENHGVAGRIVEIGDSYIMIQTPRRNLKLNYDFAGQFLPEIGQFVVAIGDRHGDEFEVIKIKQVSEQEMPMIRGDVHRRFGPLNKQIIEGGRQNRACMDGCLRLKFNDDQQPQLLPTD